MLICLSFVGFQIATVDRYHILKSEVNVKCEKQQSDLSSILWTQSQKHCSSWEGVQVDVIDWLCEHSPILEFWSILSRTLQEQSQQGVYVDLIVYLTSTVPAGRDSQSILSSTRWTQPSVACSPGRSYQSVPNGHIPCMESKYLAITVPVQAEWIASRSYQVLWKQSISREGVLVDLCRNIPSYLDSIALPFFSTNVDKVEKLQQTLPSQAMLRQACMKSFNLCRECLSFGA